MSAESTPPEQDDSPTPLDSVAEPGSTAEIEVPELTTVEAEVRAQWSGPLPPPAALREYEELYRGATERLFYLHEKQVNLYEKQTDIRIEQTRHIIEMEQRMLPASIKSRHRGQWMGYTTTLAAFVLAAFLSGWVRGVWANAVAGLTIAAFAGVSVALITGHRRGEPPE